MFISDVPNILRATAAPGQIDFAFPFAVFDADNLGVTVNGAAATYANPPVGAAQYNVILTDNVEGGTVRFGAAVATSAEVVVQRATPMTRTTQLPGAGALSVPALNRLLDRLVVYAQDAAALGRSGNGGVRNSIPADKFGAKFDGVTDDTVKLQEAFTHAQAAGGGTIDFPTNKTTIISRAIVVGSNTTVNLNGCTVRAKTGGFVGTLAGRSCFMFVNTNYDTVMTFGDAGITFNGPGTMDYNDATLVGGGLHAIAMRRVNRVTVRDIHFENGENGTALLGCRDTLTINCTAHNLLNCYFDHWDSAGTATVIACHGRNDVGKPCNQGIQFTGEGTTGTGTSSECVVAFCSVDGVKTAAGFGSGIIANSQGTGSATFLFRSTGNVIKNCDGGLVLEGGGGNHLSSGDTFQNITHAPIFLKPNASGSPSNCRVLNPHLIDCDHGAANVAMIAVAGTKNEVRGVRVTNAGAALYDLISWVSGSECVVEIASAPSGLAGRHQDNGYLTKFIEAGLVTSSLDGAINLGGGAFPRIDTLSPLNVAAQMNITNMANYTNDAAAAAGGVPVGRVYRNGSVLMVRVA